MSVLTLFLCDRELRGIFCKCVFYRRQHAQTGAGKIVQSYKNKIFSKKVTQKGVFTAYQVRGFLFLKRFPRSVSLRLDFVR